MTVLTTAAVKTGARPISRAARFRVEFVRDWKQAATCLNDLSLATPFQHPQCLDAWHGAFTGPDDVEPLIAIICDAATGEQVALLPLMALLDGAGPCSLNGNIVTTGDDFDAWRYTLERTVRKELERSWRVLTRDPAAAFRIVTEKSDALGILSTMETQQGTRMQHLGLNFILNDETCAAFYRNLVGNGVASGYVVVSALSAGEEVVATLLGIRSGSRYVMVRISNAGAKWSNCSPGRLIIERSMAALHKDGIREFDFSIVTTPISAGLAWRRCRWWISPRRSAGADCLTRCASAPRASFAAIRDWPPMYDACSGGRRRGKRIRPAAPRPAGPARIPAHRDPIWRRWPRPHKCFAEIRAAPDPAPRRCGRRHRAG